MVPLLPIGEMIDEARWLYAPTVGISLAAAALLAGGPLRGVKGWIPVLAFGALSWSAGATNFRAWRQAGDVLESARSAIAPRLEALPPGSTALVLGLPSQVNGAYCFISGKPIILERWAEPSVVNTPSPQAAVGPLGAILLFDVNGKRVFDYLDAGDRSPLPAGGAVEWSAALGPNAFRSLLAHDLDIEPRGTAWRLSAEHADAVLALPCLDLEGSGDLRVVIQGGFLGRQDNIVPADVYITHEAGGRLTRARIPVDTPFPLPPSATRARIDIPVPVMWTLEVSRVTMTLEPRK
jgi:hypothetical protein